MMAAGCAKATQSQLLPASASLTPARVYKTSTAEHVVYSFRGRSGRVADGVSPEAGLVNVNGTLYGTTVLGGAYGPRHKSGGFGTVFSITPSGAETVLHRFTGAQDGKRPGAGLIEVNGRLYGTTAYGGRGHCTNYYHRGCGTVYSISTTGEEKVLHSFTGGSDGSYPRAALTNVNGTLYGTTTEGGALGSGYGTVFTITPSGKETVLHSFGASKDGAFPEAGLIDVNGTLYGTTTFGGRRRAGTVFRITTSGKETVLHSFGVLTLDGTDPEAGLVDVNGTLYGTTFEGGAYRYGTIFAVTLAGTEKVLHSFGASDGALPDAGLISVNGTLYGTTEGGGDGGGGGTVFSITPDGTETVVYSFRGGTPDGAEPEAELIDVSGTLYSTTSGGGAYGKGTVYSLSGF
jgi:uncharacterized repeat protein (TIGR03803 family)